MAARILFSEGSSLTAREFLTVLGPAGHHIEIVDPNPNCLCRFSRWTKRVHPCPPAGSDPRGYLDVVSGLLVGGRFDVLLPTHEQAWLFAAAREGDLTPGSVSRHRACGALRPQTEPPAHRVSDAVIALAA